jgi:fructose-bisphosphate aldolase, class I
MSNPRLNRMFGPDGRCFDVAIDHGFFNEPTFLTGIEDMEGAVRTIVAAGPDAVQLSLGQAPLLQRIPGKAKPALVLRADVANVYGRELPRSLFSYLVEDAVDHALRLDAACLCVNLFLLGEHSEVHAQCVANVSRLVAAARRYELPVMVEPLVMRAGAAGGYLVDGDVERIVALVRQAVELGADVVKADPTDDLDDYGRVVEAAGGVPVLVRGGGKAGDEEILERTERLMAQGVAGIVYGRNVIQHEDPSAMTRALMAVVHEGLGHQQALTLVRGGA